METTKFISFCPIISKPTPGKLNAPELPLTELTSAGYDGVSGRFREGAIPSFKAKAAIWDR